MSSKKSDCNGKQSARNQASLTQGDERILFDLIYLIYLNTSPQHVPSCSLNMKSAEPLVLMRTLSRQCVPLSCPLPNPPQQPLLLHNFEALKSALCFAPRPEMPAISCALITTIPLSALSFNYDSPLTGVRFKMWVSVGRSCVGSQNNAFPHRCVFKCEQSLISCKRRSDITRADSSAPRNNQRSDLEVTCTTAHRGPSARQSLQFDMTA